MKDNFKDFHGLEKVVTLKFKGLQGFSRCIRTLYFTVFFRKVIDINIAIF